MQFSLAFVAYTAADMSSPADETNLLISLHYVLVILNNNLYLTVRVGMNGTYISRQIRDN